MPMPFRSVCHVLVILSLAAPAAVQAAQTQGPERAAQMPPVGTAAAVLAAPAGLAPPAPGGPALAQGSPRQFELGLGEAFDQAERLNPQLIAARRSLDLARADTTIAGAVPNPQISVQYGLGSIYTDQANAQQVGINQPIELGGKRAARLTLADSKYQLATLQLEYLRWQLHSQVRRAYAELVAARANADNVASQTALVQRLVDIARKRFEAGAAPEAELLQVQLSRQQVETQRIQAEGRIRQAGIQLVSLLGEPDPRNQQVDVSDRGLFQLSIEKTELAPPAGAALPDPDVLVERAYNRRFDLLATRQQIGVAQGQLDLAQALRTPDLTVGVSYLFTSLANGQPQANGVALGLGVTVPIFYNQQGELQKAQVSIDQTNLQVAALRAQIAAQVRAAYQSLGAARDNIRKYRDELLPASEDVLKLAQESYQVGKTSLTTAIFAQQANQQIRSGYVDAVVAYQNAWADLESAVGSPLTL